MGAAESLPEPPPPKPLSEMSIDELQRELQTVRDKIARVAEHTEVLRAECIKGERLLSVIRIARRQKETYVNKSQ